MVSGLEIRTLLRADAVALSAAFTAIGWTKPAEQFVRYAAEADAGTRTNWVATVDGQMAGYVTLRWDPDCPGITGLGIPEIQDLNRLAAVPSPRYRIRDA